MNNKHQQILFSITHSVIVVVVFITAVTIGGELLPAFKGWLKEIFFHHWIGKGVLSVALFFVVGVVGYLFSLRKSEMSISSTLMVLFWVSLIAICSILGFFVYESFAVH